jgi:UDP-glucose 4-epimerase
MQKVLVTGGLGFVGSSLVKKLNETKKYQITVMDNVSSPSSDVRYMEKNVSYVIDDILNIDNIKYKDWKFDIIFHLAAMARIQPSFNDPVSYFKNNSFGTAKICDLARRTNAKLVYAGSSSAYAGPMKSPYAYVKYNGEEIIKLFHEIYNISTVTARFFNVYGTRQPTAGEFATVVGIFERQYKDGEPLTIIGDGEQRRDFTHINDIVNGLIELSKHSFQGEVFNLGTGRNYSINELASFFDHETKYIPSRQGEARTSIADISKTKEILNWQPTHSLREYIKDFKLKLDTEMALQTF